MELKEALDILGEEISRNSVFISEVIETLNLRKDIKILDIGTGRGTMAIMLALKGYHVITGEPEGHDWADWRSSAKKVGVEDLITFKYLNAEQIPFPHSEFDAIFVYGSFHHISNKIAAVTEFMRVLNQEGIIIIIEFTPEGVDEIRKTFPSHEDAVDPRDYTKNMALTLKIIEHGNINAYIYKKS